MPFDQVKPQSASPDHLIQDATAIAAHYMDNASPQMVSIGGMSRHGDPTPLWVKNAVPLQASSPSIRVESPPTAEKPAEPSPKPGKKAVKVIDAVTLRSVSHTPSKSSHSSDMQLMLSMSTLHRYIYVTSN